MNKRIEWIEPEEATRERREQLRRSFGPSSVFTSCGMLLAYSVPVVQLLQLDLGLSEKLAIVIGSLAMVLILPAILLMAWLYSAGAWTCVLDSAGASAANTRKDGCSFLWKRASSFNIADHPTLPGIRCLTIQFKGSAQSAQFDFRVGQVDEVELRTFVEARIADVRTERLMRRVKM